MPRHGAAIHCVLMSNIFYVVSLSMTRYLDYYLKHGVPKIYHWMSHGFEMVFF